MDKQITNKGQWFIDQLNVYQSANSDHQSIKKNFIIRLNEFEIIIASLKNKEAGDSLQNELILGRRGSGKSTLLKRIEIEILEKEELKSKYIPINLAEEQAGIYRLFDLWEETLKEICHHLETQLHLKDFKEFKQEEEYTRYLYQTIHEICVTQNRKIVLLLDNFDRIVENFTDDGNLLREMLINFTDVVIIAGSTRMDEHFWSYDMPFYEFFRRHRLESLDKEELHRLLNHWSESLDIPELKTFITNNPGKIENIRLLTDGLPRTIQFFIQMVLQDAHSHGEYLKKIMDNVTPLYQERLNSLPSPFRKIILEMAFLWEACTTKQLVEKCRMDSKLISAYLKTLVDKGLIDKVETSKKNHLYRISERFFNMWLIITQGNPEQKRKAKWLSIFLENWYDANDLKKLAKNHIELLKQTEINRKDALILSKGLSQCKYITTSQRDIIIELTENLKEQKSESMLLELPQRFKSILDEIFVHVNNNNYHEALALANAIENEEDGLKFLIIGIIYYEQTNYTNALKYFFKTEQKSNSLAYYYIGLVFEKRNKNKKAEEYYLKSIENKNENALFKLALLYDNLNKTTDAEKYYLMAIEKGNENAMSNLALLYENQNKYMEAEKYYLMSIEKGNSNAIYNLALFYQNQGKYPEAEKFYLMASEKENDKAMNNLAVLYYILNINKEKALSLANKALETTVENVKLQILITLEIWNGIFNNVEERIISIIQEDTDNLYEFVFDLLVHQQKTLVLKMFGHKEFGKILQDKYSVLYYACLLLNNKTEDNLELRIPPEIKPTIDEVINKIYEKQKFYGYR